MSEHFDVRVRSRATCHYERFLRFGESGPWVGIKVSHLILCVGIYGAVLIRDQDMLGAIGSTCIQLRLTLYLKPLIYILILIQDLIHYA